MQLHNLKKNSANATKKRVGRGGARGKTSGKGHKGQKARAGNSTRPAIRDIIKKIPKLRGQGVHGNKNKEIINKSAAINLTDLEKVFNDGEVVNPQAIFEKKLIKKVKGKIPKMKILGNGKINKKIIVENLAISKTALDKILIAGGEVK